MSAQIIPIRRCLGCGQRQVMATPRCCPCSIRLLQTQVTEISKAADETIAITRRVDRLAQILEELARVDVCERG